MNSPSKLSSGWSIIRGCYLSESNINESTIDCCCPSDSFPKSFTSILVPPAPSSTLRLTVILGISDTVQRSSWYVTWGCDKCEIIFPASCCVNTFSPVSSVTPRIGFLSGFCIACKRLGTPRLRIRSSARGTCEVLYPIASLTISSASLDSECCLYFTVTLKSSRLPPSSLLASLSVLRSQANRRSSISYGSLRPAGAARTNLCYWEQHRCGRTILLCKGSHSPLLAGAPEAIAEETNICEG